MLSGVSKMGEPSYEKSTEILFNLEIIILFFILLYYKV